MSLFGKKDAKKPENKNNTVQISKKSLIRTLISLAILILVITLIIVGVSGLIDYIKNGRNGGDEDVKTIYPNMYNASRYFFRVNYPDGWNTESGRYGLAMDEETGLILEVFPQIKQTGGDDNQIETFVRDERATVSFYYKEYASDAEKDLVTTATAVFAEYSSKYTVGEAQNYHTDDIDFIFWTYSYIDSESVMHNGEAYVAVRENNYVVITYEATEDIPLYHMVFLNILDDFRFTVKAVDNID